MTSDPLLDHLRSLRLRNYSIRSIEQRQYSLVRLARACGASRGPELLALTADDLATWQDSIDTCPVTHTS